MLLSGNQNSGNELDGNIWNLDSMGAGYVVISTSSTTPALTSGTVPAGTDDTVSAGMQIDGSLAADIPFATPSLISNLSDYDSYATIVNLESTWAQANQAQHFTNGAGFTVLRDRAYENPGWSISDLVTSGGSSDLLAVPGNDMNLLPVWDSGYTGTGVSVFVTDGVNYSRQFDSADSLYASRLNGTSAAEPITSGLTALMLEANPNLNYRDVQEILVRSARGVGTTAHGRVDAEFAVKLAASWSDPLSLSDPGYDIRNHSWLEVDFGQAVVDSDVAAAGSAIGAHAQYISFIIGGEVTRSVEWSSPTAGQAILVGTIDTAVAMSHPDIAAAAETGAQARGGTSGQLPREGLGAKTGNSASDANLAQAVDDLLAQDVIFVDNSPQTNSDGIGVTVDGGIVVAAELTQPNVDVHAAGTIVVATIDGSADGGMVAIEELVEVVSDWPITSAKDHVASAENVTPIVGELTRVAVMELIEGEAEPAAPHAADHVSLLATSDTATADQSAITSGEQQSIATRVAQVIAEQAGTAASMFAPVNPAYLATIANATSQAFAAVVGAELNGSSSDASADAARSEAFSQWDDDSTNSQAATDNESSRWLDAAPILVALACERVMAAKKKRLQRDPIRRPIKVK